MRWLISIILLMFLFSCTSNTKKLIECNEDKTRLEYQLVDIQRQLEQKPDTIIVRDTVDIELSSAKIDSAKIDSAKHYEKKFKVDMKLGSDVGVVGIDLTIAYRDNTLTYKVDLNKKRTVIYKEIKEINTPPIYLPDPVTEKHLVETRAERDKYQQLYEDAKSTLSSYKWILIGVVVFGIGIFVLSKWKVWVP
jgi:hypothetical protein